MQYFKAITSAQHYGLDKVILAFLSLQPFEKVREERDRTSSRKSKKRKDRDRTSRAGAAAAAAATAAATAAAASSGGSTGGAGGNAGGSDTLGGDGEGGFAQEDADGDEFSTAGGRSGGEGTTGVIPGSHISILPSFMDDLKTRARMPVRTVVEPALPVYSASVGGVGGAVGVGVGAGGVSSGGRERGGGGAAGRGLKTRVGVEPVYKFRL